MRVFLIVAVCAAMVQSASVNYQVVRSGTCESHGMETIMTSTSCHAAVSALSGLKPHPIRFDSPAGGYTTSSSSRTRGCTMHGNGLDSSLNVKAPTYDSRGCKNGCIQFFPNAKGKCGTSNFQCVCKKKNTENVNTIMNQKAGREEFAPPMKTNYDPKRTLTCCEKKCKDVACSEGCKMWLHHSSLNWESKKWWAPLQKKCQKDCTMPRLWAA